MYKKKYERIYGGGLNRYYMVGGSIALNKTQANQLKRYYNPIETVVDGIMNSNPIDRKKSVSFIKSLAK